MSMCVYLCVSTLISLPSILQKYSFFSVISFLVKLHVRH